MRTLTRIGSAVLCLAALSAGTARAQIWDRLTNPSVRVPITHPPEVTLASGAKLAVLDFTGNPRCAGDLTFRLSQALQQSRAFEMIDQRGPDAAEVFSGRITRCSTDLFDKERAGETREKNGVVRVRYVRRAAGRLTLQISLVDVATGHIRAGDLIDIVDSLSTEAVDAEPGQPNIETLRSRLVSAAIGQIERIVLPWDETVSLVVYDDDKCGLKASAAQIKRGQLANAADALQSSVANACGAPSDKNIISKALYNLGIALTYSDQPDSGLRVLQASSAVRKAGITDEAIAATNKILALNEARRAALAELMANAPPVPQPAAPTAMLTNKDIIDLSAAKLSDAIIISKIRTSKCNFDVSTDGLIALKRAGVSDDVMLAMTDAAAGSCK